MRTKSAGSKNISLGKNGLFFRGNDFWGLSFYKLIIMVAMIGTGVSCVFAKDYALVKDGKPTSCIVLPENAGPVEKHAAEELSLFLEKVTGARVAIESMPAPDLYNIYLGTFDAKNVSHSTTIAKAVSELTNDGFVLAADKDGIQIIGKKPIGVLYGVYEILKRYASMRWFAPGAEFEYCPKKTTVSVPEQITTNNPSFKNRCLNIYCTAMPINSDGTLDWMVRNGLTVMVPRNLYMRYRNDLEKRGAIMNDGGHCFSQLLSNKLFDEHPEYFSLIDGKRVTQEVAGRGDRRQPCTSNPEVAKIMVEGIKNRYLDSSPQIYRIANNDGGGWCQCETCTKIDPLEEKEKNCVSTRFFTFVNKITSEVYKTHPDAEFWVYSYQNFRIPPLGITPLSRYTICFCSHGRCYRHCLSDKNCSVNTIFCEMLLNWKDKGNPIMTYEYNFWESHDDIPPYIPMEHVICQDIKYYKKIGLVGFLLNACPPDNKKYGDWNTRWNTASWLAQWQTLYLAAQLSWNADAGYDVLVEDMGSKYYGKAWTEMKLYRELLVKAYEETPGHAGYALPSEKNLFLYGKALEKPGVEAKLLGFLDRAEEAAAGDEIILKRVRRDREYFGAFWQFLYKEFLAKQPKELNAMRVSEKISIDANFNEDDWKKSNIVGNFIVNKDGKTADVADPQTFVKLLFDKDNIYVAIEAMEPKPDKMLTKVKEHDGPIWADNCLEIFIAAPRKDGKYVHIVFNSDGMVYDAMNTSAIGAEMKFESGIQIKVKKLTNRWVAEMRIPAEALGRKIQEGESWKINVARTRRLNDGTRQSSSWSNGFFHEPNAFRSVVFGTALLKNGDFEDDKEPDKYQKKTKWKFEGNKIPTYWMFHEGQVGTEILLTDGAASGKQFLRLKDGGIYQKLNQAMDYRSNLVAHAKVRGKGTLVIAMYCYNRTTGKNVPGKNLKKIEVDSNDWVSVEGVYKCEDDKILRLAFQVEGEIDLDDVTVTQETN